MRGFGDLTFESLKLVIIVFLSLGWPTTSLKFYTYKVLPKLIFKVENKEG